MQRVVDDVPGTRADERPLDLADLFRGFLVRHDRIVLVCLLAWVSIAAYVWGQGKPLWYDEIFSVIVAMQPNWHAMQGAMPADGNPPLLAFLIKACLHLFGTSEFSIRLPSLIGFLGALAGVFIFVRREADSFFAFLAVALVIAQPGWTYAYEARPYALLLGFMMLGLVSWQSATRSHGARTLPFAGIVLAIVGGALAHNLGILEIGLPLVFGEGARILSRRRIDWPLLATGLSAVPVLLFTYPMSRKTTRLLLDLQRGFVYPLTKARFVNYWLHGPYENLPLILNLGLVVALAVLAILSVPTRRSEAGHGNRAETHDGNAPGRAPWHVLWAAVGAFLLIPVTWLLMLSTTGYYLARYGIGSIAGIAILFALLLHRNRRSDALVPCALMVLIMGFFSAVVLHHMTYLHRERQQDSVYSDRSGLPVVIPDPFQMMVDWWYAPQSFKPRFLYLTDKPAAIPGSILLVDVALVAEAPYSGMHVENFGRFTAGADHFLLQTNQSEAAEVMKQRLRAAGYVLCIERSQPGDTLYEVTKPSRAHTLGAPDTASPNCQ